MNTRSPLVAVVASFALVLAACGGDDTTGAADDPPAEPADEAAEEADEAEVPDDADDAEVQDDGEVQDDADEAADDDGADDATAGDAAVVAVDTTELGEVLVDGEGMTLYMFDIDEQGPSACTGDCAANWPPLLTDGDPVAEAGADEALLGTAEHEEGGTQVTYDGWPLYHFIGDQAAGDVAGQAVNDVWWVIDADGTPVRDAGMDADDGANAGAGSGY